MKKVNVNELLVWNLEDMVEYFGDWDYRKGEYVLKFELGSRNENELLGEVEVKDGMFEVKDVEDICNWLKEEDGEEGDYEFVSSEIEDWWEGRNVYGENYLEEFSIVYVRVEVQMLDKIVIVCSGILIGGFVFMYVVGG